jgi:hypothetical protein
MVLLHDQAGPGRTYAIQDGIPGKWRYHAGTDADIKTLSLGRYLIAWRCFGEASIVPDSALIRFAAFHFHPIDRFY